MGPTRPRLRPGREKTSNDTPRLGLKHHPPSEKELGGLRKASTWVAARLRLMALPIGASPCVGSTLKCRSLPLFVSLIQHARFP